MGFPARMLVIRTENLDSQNCSMKKSKNSYLFKEPSSYEIYSYNWPQKFLGGVDCCRVVMVRLISPFSVSPFLVLSPSVFPSFSSSWAFNNPRLRVGVLAFMLKSSANRNQSPFKLRLKSKD
jgi:hypothetical protein